MILAVCVGLIATACSQGAPLAQPSSPSPLPASATPSAGSPSPRGRCETPGKEYADTVDGRRVIVRVPQPAKFSPSGIRGVIVALHGYNGEAQDFLRYTGLDRSSPYDVVVIAPQGQQTPAGGAGWNFGRSAAFPSDDVAFIDTLLEHYRHSLCLDLTKVVVTGWSDGADMAVTYSCHGSHPVQQIAVVAAAYAPDGACANVRNIWLIHGKKDPIEPYDGGSLDGRKGFPNNRSQSAPQMLDQWARVQGCAKALADTRDQWSYTSTARNCRSNGAVTLTTVPDGGHPWPGATYDIDSQYGPTEHRGRISEVLLQGAG